MKDLSAKNNELLNIKTDNNYPGPGSYLRFSEFGILVPKRQKNEVIVMEGFMDVIRASTVGINNCIATMGTALTKQNANLLKKMANNIILCFDGDKAGEEATINAISIFKEIDVTPKIAITNTKAPTLTIKYPFRKSESQKIFVF